MDGLLDEPHLPGYEIEALIQRGGMGMVYLARDTRLNRKVALKLLGPSLSADEGFRKRFQRESEIAASLDHPNIVPIYEFGETDGVLFISMRYVDGSDLRTVLERERGLSLDRTLGILRQIAGALDAAHSKGLVHRDVKPGNVLLTETGGLASVEHVYLSDFGLTKHVRTRSGLTGTGQFIGSIDYMAPEQIQGPDFDHRVDIYALGCVGYECLAGRVPFPRQTDAGVLAAHLLEAPVPLTTLRPELPGPISDVYARAMAKSPDDRFSTCGEFLRAAESARNAPAASSRGRRRRGRGRETFPPAQSAEAADPSARGFEATKIRSGSGQIQLEHAAAPSHAQHASRRLASIIALLILGLGAVLAATLIPRSSPKQRSSLEAVALAPSSRLLFQVDSPSKLRAFISSPEQPAPIPHAMVTKRQHGPVASSVRTIALATDRAIVVNDVKTGNELWRVKTDTKVVDLEFGPKDVLVAALQAPGTGGTITRIAVIERGGRRLRLIAQVNGFASSLAWSPDAQSIAFSATRGATQQLFVVGISGGEAQHRLNVGMPVVDDPAWSPDGLSLAFSASRGTSLDIYVGNVEAMSQAGGENPPSSAVRRVTQHVADESHPAWSPDGRFIAFIRTEREESAIHVTTRQGAEARRLAAAMPGSCCLEWLGSGVD